MKKLRCRVGDLCLVIKAHNPCNLGKVVTIVAAYDPAISEFKMEGADWVVECPSTLKWTRGKDAEWLLTRGPLFDESLLPIRGDQGHGPRRTLRLKGKAKVQAPRLPAPLVPELEEVK